MSTWTSKLGSRYVSGKNLWSERELFTPFQCAVAEYMNQPSTDSIQKAGCMQGISSDFCLFLWQTAVWPSRDVIFPLVSTSTFNFSLQYSFYNECQVFKCGQHISYGFFLTNSNSFFSIVSFSNISLFVFLSMK